MNDYRYIILRIDKTNCFTPQACNDMTYKDLFKANHECQYYNEKEENEDFEYKVFELKEKSEWHRVSDDLQKENEEVKVHRKEIEEELKEKFLECAKTYFDENNMYVVNLIFEEIKEKQTQNERD